MKKCLLHLSVFAAAIILLNMPATTKQGLNGVVTDYTIPLYVKACGFLYRDYHYQDLSRRITDGIENDKEKIAAIYAWTVDNIKKQPEGFTVIDDHVWDIVARRYGEADQMADVFTTLVSYAGYEAFWVSPKVSRYLILSFVRIKDEWRIFDVYNKKSFIEEGRLEEATPFGITYKECIDRLDKSIFEPQLRRPDRQKIFTRPIYEIERFFLRRRRSNDGV